MKAELKTSTRQVPVDVILRDGSTLRLRPPTRSDVEALVEFFARLSDRSRHLRFHGARRIFADDVEQLVEPDWDDRGVLIGTLAEPAGGEHVVAMAEYARLRDPSAAEVAFAVADDLQGHGAGTRLVEQLAVRAAETGVRVFVAEVLPENVAMLRVFRTRASSWRARWTPASSRSGFPSRRRRSTAPASSSVTTRRLPLRSAGSSHREASP